MSQNAARPDRLATLDLLRLVAALAVVAFHYLFRGAAGAPMLDVAFPQAEPFAIYGYLGVNLFFLISGFVIAWSAEGRDGTSFAIARFARIYPGFVVCMAISFAVLWFVGDPRLPATPSQFAANLMIFAPALGQPFMDGVYWSIVLELIFYGWVALALLFGVFERWKLPLVAGWLAVSMLNEFVIGSGALRLVLITEFGPWFAGGILIQHIWRHGRSAEALMLLAASFAVSCAMMPTAQNWMLEHYGRAVPAAGLVLANAAMFALLIATVAAGRFLAPSPLLLAAGGLTYPLYLLHQHIGYAAINLATPLTGEWLAAGLVTAAMLVASLLVWRHVETPLRRPLVAGLTALAARLTLLPRPQTAPA